MDEKLLCDKFRGCLVGAAIGDALGRPVETLSHDQIMEATGGKGVKGYIPSIQRQIADTRDLPPGSTTDDTQQGQAVCRSLIYSRGFNLFDQARKMVESGTDSPFNYGLATKQGMEQIGLWFASRGRQGRHPNAIVDPPKKQGGGCGNGVAMKIESLALHHAALYGTTGIDPLLADVLALGMMTHGDPRASISAYAMSVVIGRALLGEDTLLEEVVANTLVAEERYRFFRSSDERFSGALMMARAHLGSAKELREYIGTGGNCMESVAFSIATSFRHATDFRTGVLEAVNAGGDTDTTASMVGGMIGASVGLSGIPSDLVLGLLPYRVLIRAADDLLDVVKEQ